MYLLLLAFYFLKLLKKEKVSFMNEEIKKIVQEKYGQIAKSIKDAVDQKISAVNQIINIQ